MSEQENTPAQQDSIEPLELGRSDDDNAIASEILVDLMSPELLSIGIGDRCKAMREIIDTLKCFAKVFPPATLDFFDQNRDKLDWYFRLGRLKMLPENKELILGSLISEKVPPFKDLCVNLFGTHRSEMDPSEFGIPTPLVMYAVHQRDIQPIIQAFSRSMPLILDESFTLMDLVFGKEQYISFVQVLNSVAERYPVKFNS